MKVAFLLRKFPVLSETFILDQIVELIRQGVDVDIYSIYRGDESDSHPLLKRYHLLELTRFPTIPFSQKVIVRLLRSPQLFWTAGKAPFHLQVRCLNIAKYRQQAFFLHLLYLSSILDGNQTYDIIHCHFGMYGLVGADLRDLGLIHGKLVTSFHGMDIHVYPKRYGVSVYQRLFTQGDLFTVNSNFTKSKLLQMGCPFHKLVKLPVGLRTQQYVADFIRKDIDVVRILTVARLTEKKGIRYAIKAVARLHNRFPYIQYEIVGKGPLHASLRELIYDLEASDYIHLIGPRDQSELRHLYTHSHIFVLPSITASNGDMEGQGLVLQEAQASGLPVVSTWHNGIPEGILVDQSGFLVPERDIESLAEKLACLIEDKHQRQQMGEVGQAFVRQHFDVEHLSERLLTFYEGLL